MKIIEFDNESNTFIIHIRNRKISELGQVQTGSCGYNDENIQESNLIFSNNVA